jgi:hypothetical protein
MLSERPVSGREFIRGMNGQLFIGNPVFQGRRLWANFLGYLFVSPQKGNSPVGANTHKAD